MHEQASKKCLDNALRVVAPRGIGSAIVEQLSSSVSATPVTVNASISPDTNVNMVSFLVSAGQVVDFDIGYNALRIVHAIARPAANELAISLENHAGEDTLGSSLEAVASLITRCLFRGCCLAVVPRNIALSMA